ncbi:MAG: MobA/MobL family protein [Cognatishimia sp.]|nr:MobA/MobL family protein [Cognatishimia sp.]
MRAFAERLSKGIAGYVVATHDQHGTDTKNPHAHFVFFDLQQKTGGRGRPKSTLGLARKNAIEGAAKLWAELHNEMMGGWDFGPDSKISHLSFADRGIDRVPTIHEGASARATPEAKKTSKEQWKHIDHGRTRAEANAVIREINQLKDEQENAGTVRLGTSDGDNEVQCNGGIAEQRKRSSRNVETATGNRPPFMQAGQPDEGHRPIGSYTGAANHPQPNPARPRPGRQSGFPPLARLGLLELSLSADAVSSP